MREHMGIFRGKRIDNGEWVEGYYVHYKNSRLGKDGHVIFEILSNGEIHPMATSALVDPTTIGECTGLKDKNGKLIFEGDIVREFFEGVGTEYDYTDFGTEGFKYDFEGYKIGKVTFGGYGTFITSTYGELFIEGEEADYKPTRRKRLAAYRCEIIGNIHDNPELLKGGEGA